MEAFKLKLAKVPFCTSFFLSSLFRRASALIVRATAFIFLVDQLFLVQTSASRNISAIAFTTMILHSMAIECKITNVYHTISFIIKYSSTVAPRGGWSHELLMNDVITWLHSIQYLTWCPVKAYC